jgi:hypothetical protein
MSRIVQGSKNILIRQCDLDSKAKRITRHRIGQAHGHEREGRGGHWTADRF